MFDKIKNTFKEMCTNKTFAVTGNPIEDVDTWMEVADQKREVFDSESIRTTALYVGLQCEELAEKLSAIGLTSVVEILMDTANEFKSGYFDGLVESSINRVDSSVAMLDADMDLIWVSIGASLAAKFDAHNAWEEVARSNFDKFKNGVIKDSNGKIKKPEGWKGPDLVDFV